jgi:3-deoxy-D-manno-octulosonic-acid transferase
MEPREHAERGGGEAARVAAELITLYGEFPAWAVWLPAGGTWTAVRPASSRPPDPRLPMIWVHAASAGELAVAMRASQAQLDGSC